MAKTTSFARQQTHGVSDPLSGATIAPSNDHTDGSWAITDIYDRELLINTGNGNLQYRAGIDIYTVSSSPTATAIKSITAPIGTWNMTTAAAIDGVSVTISELIGKTIIGVDLIILKDDSITFSKYDFGINTTYDYPLRVVVDTSGGFINIDCLNWPSNAFRRLADTLSTTYQGTTVNRGNVTVTYID